MSDWKTASTHTHTIAGISELYEQLLPTNLYNARKTKPSEESDQTSDVGCVERRRSLSHMCCQAAVHWRRRSIYQDQERIKG